MQGQVETRTCSIKILPIVSTSMLDDSFSGKESDLDDPVDDSDGDSDFTLPNETNHQADVLSGLSQSESENEDGDLDGESDNENFQVDNCFLSTYFSGRL